MYPLYRDFRESIMSEIILKSEVGIDYSHLRDLLAAEKWHKADKLTRRLVLKAANCEGYLDNDDWLEFPCTDLRTIDQLWVEYSKGHFRHLQNLNFVLK